MSATTASELAAMRERATSDINQAIEDAKKEAQSILNLARATAQGISLEDVQTQFKNAGNDCLSSIKLWASLSVSFIVVFIVALIGFLTWWEPYIRTTTQGNSNSALIVYHTVIRVTMLTALAAVTTFCMKVLRAQLHLREQNLHRQRVANSIAAFLGAASAEQRDVILGRMVDAITAFGSSGLLSDNDDSMSPAKVILESVPRVLSQKG